MKKSRTIFIAAITTLVVSGIFFTFYFNNKIKNIKKLRASIESLYVPETQGEKISKGLTELNRLFPQKSRTTEFIENAFLISKKHSIRNMLAEYKNKEVIELGSIKQLTTGRTPVQKTGFIYSYPVKISFNSGYRNMAEFIREIQNQDGLVTVKSLKAEKEKNQLSVDLVVSIYSTEER